MTLRAPSLLALALVLAACAAKPPAPPADPTAALLRAESLLAAGEADAAVDAYLAAARGSDDPALLGRAATVAAAVERGAEARALVERWAELAPDDARAQARLAMLRFDARELDGAVAALARVRALSGAEAAAGLLLGGAPAVRAKRVLAMHLAAFPDDAAAAFALATAAWRGADLTVAADAAARALELKPGWEDATLLAARIAVRRGEGVAALADLEALGQRPNAPLALGLAAGMLRAEAGDAEGARSALARIVAIDPDDALPRIALAAVLADQRRYAEAMDTLRVVSEHNGRDDVRLELGRLAERSGDVSEALLWYREVERDEYAAAAAAGIARVLAKNENLESGRKFLQTARAGQPEWAPTLTRIEAELLRAHGKPKDAQRLLTEALVALPRDEDLRYSRAMAAVDAADLRVALEDLRALLAAEPDDPLLLNALGYTLADAGRRLAEAEALLTAALEGAPDEAAVLDSFGWVKFRRGDPLAARGYLERAYRMDGDAEIAAHLGEVLWTLGERDAARGVWAEARAEAPDDRVLAATVARLDR
jgi:tetratricopeptide (TPR) repeat protein